MPSLNELTISLKVDTKPLDALSRGAKKSAGSFKKLSSAVGVSSVAVDKFNSSLETVKAPITELAETTANAVPRMVDTFDRGFTELKGLAEGFGSGAAAVLDETLFTVMEGRFDDIGSLWRRMLGSMLRGFLDTLRGIASQTIPLNVGVFGQGLVPGLAGGIAGGIGAGSNPLSGLFGSSGGLSIGGLDIPAAGIGSALTGVLGFLNGGAGGIGVGIGGAVGAGLSFIPGVGPLLGAIAPIVGGLIGSVFGSAKKEFKLALEGALDDIQTGIPGGREGGGDFSLITTRGEKFKEPFLEVFRSTIDVIADTLGGFSPDAVAELLEAEISLRGGGRFKSGEKARKNLQAFITGGFIRPLFEQIEGSFVTPFTGAGVSAEAAGRFTTSLGSNLDQIFEQTKDWEDREKRGELMLEALDAFLAQMTQLDTALTTLPDRFRTLAEEIANSGASLETIAAEISTLTEAAALLEPEALDPMTRALSQILSLSEGLGFEGVPAMDEFRSSLERLIETAELDPEVVNQYKTLAAAIETARIGLTRSVSSLSGLVAGIDSQLGIQTTIPADALRSAIEAIRERLSQGGISAEGREGLLNELGGLAAQFIAQTSGSGRIGEELEAVEGRIDALKQERSLIDDNFKVRRRALEEELRMVERFKDLNEQIKRDLTNITFGQGSPLTAIEKFNRLRGEIGSAQAALGGASTDDERFAAIDRLRTLQNQLFSLGGGAFFQNSAELQGVFTEVTGALTELIGLTDSRTRTVEEINSEIERLNSEQAASLTAIESELIRLEAQAVSLNDSLQNAAENLSADSRELLEFMRSEALSLLELRLGQLGELGGDEIEELKKQTGLLETLAERIPEEFFAVLRNVQPFAHGGVVNRPTLALIGERGPEAVIPLRPTPDFQRFRTGSTPQRPTTGAETIVNIHSGAIVVNGGQNGKDGQQISKEILKELSIQLRRGGLGRQLRR